MKKILSIAMLSALISVPAFGVEETFWTKAQDASWAFASHPATIIVTATAGIAGISALITAWYNKVYVEKKKNKINPGMIAGAFGLLTATAAGTYFYYTPVHAYFFPAKENAPVNVNN